MTNAVNSSSSYEQEIVKFYEQMEELQQGRQKNYTRTSDADDFCLERELEKLKVRTARSDISPRPQLATNSQTRPHIQFQAHIMDEARRVRNQEILAKIQELQMNASVFEARSERLREMRKEYEALVDKYSCRRKFTSVPFNSTETGSTTSPSRQKRVQTELDLNPVSSRSSFSRPIPIVGMASIGVNTDISGPVRSVEEDKPLPRQGVIGINNTRLISQTLGMDEEDGVAQKPLAMPIFFRKYPGSSLLSSGDGCKDQNIIHEVPPDVAKIYHLCNPDPSSTESDLDHTVTRDKQIGKYNLADETLSDSMSFSLPGKPLHLNVTSESESTFSVAPTRNRTDKLNAKEKTENKAGFSRRHSDASNNELGEALNHKILEKKFSEGEGLSDSPTSLGISAAESFIDSTAQNKTPDTLPRDESELEIVDEGLEQRTDNSEDVSDKEKNKDSESDPKGTEPDVAGSSGITEKKIMEMKPIETKLNSPTKMNFPALESYGQSTTKILQPFQRRDSVDEKATVELKENEMKRTEFAPEQTSKENTKLERVQMNMEEILQESEGKSKEVAVKLNRRQVQIKVGYEDSFSEEDSEKSTKVPLSSATLPHMIETAGNQAGDIITGDRTQNEGKSIENLFWNSTLDNKHDKEWDDFFD